LQLLLGQIPFSLERNRFQMNIFASQVLKEVGSLPEAQREAVLLVYVEGLTYREAAEILTVPIGTVMSRLAAARLTLGKLRAAPEPERARRKGENGPS
jgi:RNA polymerase sigma-70 factor (ECF subfamily)